MKEPVSLSFGGDPKPAEAWYIKGQSSASYAVIGVQTHLPARDIEFASRQMFPALPAGGGLRRLCAKGRCVQLARSNRKQFTAIKRNPVTSVYSG